MALRAVRFRSIPRRRRASPKNVSLVCRGLQMRGIHAATMRAGDAAGASVGSMAQMVEFKSGRDRADELLVRVAMSSDGSGAIPEASISLRSHAPGPEPALATLVHVCPEPLLGGRARIVGGAVLPLAAVVQVAQTLEPRWRTVASVDCTRKISHLS